MKLDLLTYLCCPDCRGDLKVESADGEQSITEGMLGCVSCARTYPVRNGVARFVGSDGYVNTFSYEWNKWSRVQLDEANRTKESEETFIEKTGFRPEELNNKLVLDAGCGAGRFLDVVSRGGARTVGVDFSFAVDAAQANVGARPNVDIVQADLFHLPFKERVFDAIFSIGVLHHTCDTREAFLRLPPLLKEEGELAVWLYYYPDGLYCLASDFWRAVFRYVPHRVLYVWCWILVALLSDLYRRPFMSRRPWSHLRRVLPVNTHDSFEWRVLDTFDWYSPRYQDKACSVVRTVEWFREAGLTYLDVLEVPTAIRGRKSGDSTLPLFRSPLMDVRAKRILVFGAGAGGNRAFDELERLGFGDQVVGVCDNALAKIGTMFRGHYIRRFGDVPRDEYDLVVVASLPGKSSISEQLRSAGLVEKQDFASLTFITDFSIPLLES